MVKLYTHSKKAGRAHVRVPNALDALLATGPDVDSILVAAISLHR